MTPIFVKNAIRLRKSAWSVALTALVLVMGCSTSITRPRATTWTGSSIEVPRASKEGSFVPSKGLQFLVDPYPSDSGPSWLGGDVASSIRLTENRYLWLFGDSLMGSVSDQCADQQIYCDRRIGRENTTGMIRNSVGITQRADDEPFERIVKWWNTTGGTSSAIFPGTADGRFYWPLAGIRAETPVFIAANLHTRESGLIPVGNTILRITNPDADPPDWEITTHPLPNFRQGGASEPGLSWTMALARIDRHVYIFGSTSEGFNVNAVLSRVEVEAMTAPTWSAEPEYLMVDDTGSLFWGSDFEFDRLHVVRGLPGVSETTIQYDPDLGWFSYQLEPFGFQIQLYTAPDLEGPWRNSGVVYEIPSPWSTEKQECTAAAGASCPSYIAYAVKAHPELAPENGHVISYNVNVTSGVLRAAEEATENVHGFYVPQMLIGPNSRPSSDHPTSESAP